MCLLPARTTHDLTLELHHLSPPRIPLSIFFPSFLSPPPSALSSSPPFLPPPPPHTHTHTPVPCPQVGASKGASTVAAKKRVYHKPYFVEGVCFGYYVAMTACCAYYRNWAMTGYCAIMTVSFLVMSFGDYIF